MATFSHLPGFRDFYPEDLALRAHIFDVWRRVARRYGFEEFDGPPLESLDLYTSKSGPEIVNQLYAFKDKGDRDVALRPEMTPTLARMVGARANGMRKPIKWFCIPQCFRYERQQKGRLKEFYQVNYDILGEPSVSADAELAALAIDVMREFGFNENDFELRYSDRRFVVSVLAEGGVAESGIQGALMALDKFDPAKRADGVARLSELAGIDIARAETIVQRLLENKTPHAPTVSGTVDNSTDELSAWEITEFNRTLKSMKLFEFVRFDPSIVRGLAYYTGIVFEVWDKKGEFRAISGGGRYDGLVGQMSGTDLPASGFAMGDVVIGEMLKAMGKAPEYKRSLDAFAIALSEQQQSIVLQIVHALRDADYSVDYGVGNRNKQFKNVSALGAEYAIIVGPDEVASGELKLQHMVEGREVVVSIDSLLAGKLPSAPKGGD